MSFWEEEFKQESGGKSSNKAEFVTFPQGITRLRIVDEKPLVRWVHWMPGVANVGKGRSANCPGRGCPVCAIRQQMKANGEKSRWGMQKKWAIQVINRETNRIEILDQGRDFFDDIRAVMDDNAKDHGYISNYDIKVRRTGEGNDTKYRIDFDKAYELTEADQKLMETRRNLEEYFAPTDSDKLVRILAGEKWEDVFANQQNNADSNTDEEIVVK